MRTCFSALALLFCIHAGAQPNDSLLREQYCLVRLYAAGLGSLKVEVTVDSGQVQKRRLVGVDVMRDEETGRKKVFLSEADALNYFGAAGWKLVIATPVAEGSSSYTNYLFKKLNRVAGSDQ